MSFIFYHLVWSLFLSRWWFQIFSIFTPTWGFMIQFDDHIFRMGSNHQLVMLTLILSNSSHVDLIVFKNKTMLKPPNKQLISLTLQQTWWNSMPGFYQYFVKPWWVNLGESFFATKPSHLDIPLEVDGSLGWFHPNIRTIKKVGE